MKLFKNITFCAFLILSLLLIHSCSNDDGFLEQQHSSNQTTSGSSSTGNDSSDPTDNGQSTGNTAGSEGEITLYRVMGNSIEKIKDFQVSGQNLAFQQDLAKHQEIWTLVKKIVPENYRSKMSEFLIYSGASNQTAGFVVETTNDLTKWKMVIAIDYAYERGFNANGELAYTVVHEFGHILSLNNTQVDASIPESSCTNYYPGEGCSKSAAYINNLYKNHWADIWAEYTTAKNQGQGALSQFYNTYASRYVTQYSATNPGEDIAEVFAHFVTKSNKPTGNSGAEKKILALYERQELVQLRNYIRANLNFNARSKNGIQIASSWKQGYRIGNPHKMKCGH